MSLIVWLPLNGDLHNQGISDLIFSTASSSTTTNTNGKIGTCYTNNSHTTGGLISNKPILLGAQYSMCCWFKFTDLEVNSNLGGGLISQHRYSKSTGFGLTIKYVSSTTGYLSVNTGTGSSRTFNTYCGTTLLQANTWYHACGTYDGTNIKIYVNGILEKTQAYTMSAPEDYLTIFCWSLSGSSGATIYDGYKLNGALNDVRIYNHCLSAAEVKEIAQGLVLHYKLDASSEEKITTIPSTNVYSYPTFNTSATGGGWNHWGPSGHSGNYGQNTDKKYIYNKNNTYSHWITENAGTGKYYLLYQSPAFEGGYRSLQAIIKEENSLPITESICYPTWNAQNGGVPNNKWTSIKSLGDGFYYCCCEGVSQNGSNDLIGIDVNSGYKIYVSECYLENDTETCSPIFTYSSNIIQDSSGYSHNGSILNSILISSDAPRYSTSTNLVAGNSAINCGRGAMVTDSITVNLWLKSSTWANPVSCTESGGWNFESNGDYFRFPVFISGVGYKYGISAIKRTELCNNQWRMLTGVYDRINGRIKIYIDGELNNDYNAGTTNVIGYNGSNVIWLGAEASSSSTAFASNGMAGLFSDFRIYCTALSAANIKQLYEVGAKVDNRQNLHTYEFNENGSNKLTKTGIFKNYAIEPYKTLPDGSYWKLMLFHYVNNGTNLFTSSNATYNNGFGLYSRLRDIANYTYDSKYEYYVIQDGKEFRWTQTSSPTATSITGLTTVSGYNNPVNGLAKPSSLTQTYIGYNTWWGACGCWTKYSTGGKTGIPGFGSHDGNGICTNYLALYTRIEKPKIEIANENIYTESLIEF